MAYAIVGVVDTREARCFGGRWRVVAGTGVERTCDACGRTHEVIVILRDDDGAVLHVGVGCAGLRSGVDRRVLARMCGDERRRLIREGIARAADMAVMGETWEIR